MKSGYIPLIQWLSPKIEELAKTTGGTGLDQQHPCRFNGAQLVDAAPSVRVGTVGNERWGDADSGGDHNHVVGGEDFDVRHRGCRGRGLAAHAVRARCLCDERTRGARPKACPRADRARAREIVDA